jgi:xanthine dehydrogenase accessory factor
VRPVLVDQRPEELALAPAGVETRLTPLPEQEVRRAPPGAAFVVLTHDHALDFLIAREALARGDAAYVGMIGSRTKRVSFQRWLKRAEGAPPDTAPLVCPIGAAGRPDKRPEVIAAFVAAEILTSLATWQARTPAVQQGPMK